MSGTSPVRRFALVSFALSVLLIVATASAFAGYSYGLVSSVSAFRWLWWIAVGAAFLIAPAGLISIVSLQLRDTRAIVYSGFATLALCALSGMMMMNQSGR
jgi:hypothetical protein